jgi:hypothetical protein
VEGSVHCTIYGIISPFRRDWGKPQKISVRMLGQLAFMPKSPAHKAEEPLYHDVQYISCWE